MVKDKEKNLKGIEKVEKDGEYDKKVAKVDKEKETWKSRSLSVKFNWTFALNWMVIDFIVIFICFFFLLKWEINI